MKPLKLEILFGARDRLSPALRAMIGGSNATNQALKKTTDQLKNLQAQQKQLEGYEKQKTAIEQNNTALHQMQQRMAQLKTEISNNKFKQYSQELQTAQNGLDNTNKKLQTLNANQCKVDGFFTQKRAILDTTKSLEGMQSHIQQLKQQMQNNGSAKLSQEFKKATTQADQLKNKLNEQKQALQTTRNELNQTGIQTKGLAQTQVNLRQQIDQANTATSRYKKSVAELEQQQQKEKKALDDLSKQLKTTETEASKLTSTIGTQKTKLKQLEEGLKETGLSSHGLADQQGKLKQQITETNTSLDSQKKKLANLNRVRESSNNIKQNAQMAAAHGAGMMATGTATAYAMTKPINESKLYELEENKIGALNFGDKITKSYIDHIKKSEAYGLSQVEKLELGRDAISVLSDQHHAEMVLPTFYKTHFANNTLYGQQSAEENDREFNSILRVVEERRGLTSPEAFNRQANMMQQVKVSSGNMVTASDYFLALKYGKVAMKAMSDDALYFKSEPIIQSIGASTFGTGISSANQNLIAGKTTTGAVRRLLADGLIGDKSKIIYNKLGDVTHMQPGALKDSALYQKDPFEWVKTVLIPSFRKKGITKEQDILNEINSIITNSVGANIISEIYLKQSQIEKNYKQHKKAENIDQAYARAKETAKGTEINAHANLQNAYLELGNTILPIYTKALELATDKLILLTDWMQKNPEATKAIGIGLMVIAGSLLAIGGALVIFSPLIAGMMTLRILMFSFSPLSMIFKFLGNSILGFGKLFMSVGRLLLTNPLLLAITLIAVAAYLIYKNWEPIKAFFLELWDSISKWAGDAWQGLKNGASDAWNGICNFFGNIGNWFSEKWTSVKNSANDTWEGLKTGASDAWNGICNFFSPAGEWFSDKWTSIKDGASDAWESTKSGAGTAYDKMTETFSPVKEWFKNRWDDIKIAFSGGISGVGQLILNWSPIGLFYKAFQKVMDWFGVELPSTFSGFGSMIIDGLISGIEKGFDKLKGVWAKVNSWMPDWTRKTMDIHSPSRVMRGLGRFIVDGLGVGVEQGQDSLKGKFNNTLNLFNQDNPQIDLSSKISTSLQAVKDISLEPILAKIRPINLTPQMAGRGSTQPQLIQEGDITIHIHAQPSHSPQDIAMLVRQEIARAKRAESAKQRTAFADWE